MDLAGLLDRIDAIKDAVDARRPLTPDEARGLDDYYRIGLTYTSNALEGSTLTITETKVLLEDGLTANGRPLKDSLEAVGHAKAYDFMLHAARAPSFTFSEATIGAVHRLFYTGIDPVNAGVYRTGQVIITGTDYTPPPGSQVPALMSGMVTDLNQERDNGAHPVALAAHAHRRLVDIHPFVDGNGRTARLLMNLVLVNHGYQIVSIPPVLRQEYIDALRADDPSDAEFVTLVAECELEALRDLCRMFHIDPPDPTTA